MGSFLASSVKTVFHRNDLRGVQTVIDVGFPKMGEIWREGSRLIDGLKWSGREEGSPLASAYFRKGNTRERQKRTF